MYSHEVKITKIESHLVEKQSKNKPEGRGGEGREYWMIYIEGQAFLLSYDLAPRPPPLPSVSCTADTKEGWERETPADGRGDMGEEPNHTTAGKPGPL